MVLVLGLGTQSRPCSKTDHPEYQRQHQATFRPALRAPIRDHFPFPNQVPRLAATSNARPPSRVIGTRAQTLGVEYALVVYLSGDNLAIAAAHLQVPLWRYVSLKSVTE